MCATVPSAPAGASRVGTGDEHIAHHITTEGKLMNNIIYIVGLVVIVVAILSFIGLR